MAISLRFVNSQQTTKSRNKAIVVNGEMQQTCTRRERGRELRERDRAGEIETSQKQCRKQNGERAIQKKKTMIHTERYTQTERERERENEPEYFNRTPNYNKKHTNQKSNPFLPIHRYVRHVMGSECVFAQRIESQVNTL